MKMVVTSVKGGRWLDAEPEIGGIVVELVFVDRLAKAAAIKDVAASADRTGVAVVAVERVSYPRRWIRGF